MSAPVESKLCGLNVPRFMFGSYVGESILQDSIGHVEEDAHVFPFQSLDPKYFSEEPHLESAQTFILFPGLVPGSRAPKY